MTVLRKRESHIFKRDKDDWFVEPAWVSLRLFETEKFSGLLWDPACGGGEIVKSAIASGKFFRVMGSDIKDRRQHKLMKFHTANFLTDRRRPSGIFSVVTNPPFKYVEEFAQRAIDIGAKKIAMIMLTRRLNAAHWMREMPLKKVLMLTPRPSMPPGEWLAKGNKPGGGTQDFCWVIIQPGYTGVPEFGWLQRDA